MNTIRFSVAAATIFFSGIALAGSGLPDTSFGDGSGYRVLPFDAGDEGVDDVADMLTLAQHRILLVGTTQTPARTAFTLAWLDESGTLDPGMGVGGLLVSQPPGEQRNVHATSAALQDDGRIVVAGFVEADGFGIDGDRNVFVCQFLPDGTLDPAFGGANVAYAGCEEFAFDVGGSLWDVPLDVITDSEGRIVLVGYSTRAGNRVSALSLRIDAGGEFDPTFSGLDLVADGWSVWPPADYPNPQALLYSQVTLLPNGDLLFGAQAWQTLGLPGAGTPTLIGVFRSPQDGYFNTETNMFSFPGAEDRRNTIGAMVVDGERVLVAGDGEFSPGQAMAHVRALHLDDLSIDTSFAAQGVYSSQLCECSDARVRGMTVQDDGRIVLASTVAKKESEIVLTRLTAGGAPDAAFGIGGTASLLLDVAHSAETARAIALQDGQVLVAGQVETGSDAAFAIARITAQRIFRDGLE